MCSCCPVYPASSTMAEYCRMVRRAGIIPLHIIAAVQVILLSYTVWDLIVTDAVGRPLVAENIGMSFLSSLMILVTVFLITWRTEVSASAEVESAVASIVMSLVSSCRLISVLAGTAESTRLEMAVGGLGIAASVLLGVWVFTTAVERRSELFRQASSTQSSQRESSRSDEAGVGTVSTVPPSRCDQPSYGERFDSDIEPPPYSQSGQDTSGTCSDDQPLLQNRANDAE